MAVENLGVISPGRVANKVGGSRGEVGNGVDEGETCLKKWLKVGVDNIEELQKEPCV